MNLLKIAFLSLFITTSIFAKEYIVNKSSSAVFKLKYQKTKDVQGYFNNLSGVIDYDESKNKIISLNGDITIDSIEVGNDILEELILSQKILNNKSFPKISFVAVKIEEDKIYGNLTIKNVTRSVEFDIENSGVFLDTLYLQIDGKIQRGSFDLSWDELLDIGSSAVSKDINISISIEANLKSDINFQYIKQIKK